MEMVTVHYAHSPGRFGTLIEASTDFSVVRAAAESAEEADGNSFQCVFSTTEMPKSMAIDLGFYDA